MPIQTGLYRRNATWAFRIRVPARLAEVIGRQHLKRSLQTRDPGAARLRGARLLRIARELFRKVESRLPMLKRDEIEEMIRGFYAVRLEEWQLERYRRWEELDEEIFNDPEWKLRRLPEKLQRISGELEIGMWRRADPELIHFKELFGIEVEPGSRDEALVKQYLMRALRQLTADQIAVRTENYNGEVVDPLFERPLPDPAIVRLQMLQKGECEAQDDLGDLPVPAGQDRVGRPRAQPGDVQGLGGEMAQRVFGDAISAALEVGGVDRLDADPARRQYLYPNVTFPSAKALMTIPEIFPEFMEAKQKAERSSKTLGDYKRSLAAFVEIAGLRPVGAYDRSHVYEFSRLLQKVPARHRVVLKTTSYRAAAELNEAADKKLATMSGSVINHKYITNVCNFFRWARRAGMIDENPAEDMQVEEPRGAPKKPRRPFTIAELQSIFNAPVFTGCKSEAQFMAPGSCRLRNRYYWAPLLALFTGCRLNELGQLRRSHVVEDQGAGAGRWWLRITTQPDPEDVDDAQLLLKTASAERLVPLHPFIISLGFIEYVSGLPTSEDRRVFPDWEKGSDGYYSSPFSKWFNERFLGAKLGIKAPDIVFHSLRHNFKDALRRARVEEKIQNRLLGHADESVGDRYGSRMLLPEEAVVIDSIEYPGLDLSRLAAGA